MGVKLQYSYNGHLRPQTLSKKSLSIQMMRFSGLFSHPPNTPPCMPAPVFRSLYASCTYAYICHPTGFIYAGSYAAEVTFFYRVSIWHAAHGRVLGPQQFGDAVPGEASPDASVNPPNAPEVSDNRAFVRVQRAPGAKQALLNRQPKRWTHWLPLHCPAPQDTLINTRPTEDHTESSFVESLRTLFRRPKSPSTTVPMSMQYSNLLRVLKIHQNDLFSWDDDDIFSPDVSMSIPGTMHAMQCIEAIQVQTTDLIRLNG